jgi:anti-anti-sigma factor
MHRPLRLSGEIDLATALEVENLLLAYAEQQSEAEFVIDCSELEFIDSAGVRAIVSVGQRTRRTPVLLDPNPTLRRLVEITGLDSAIELRTRADTVPASGDPSDSRGPN